MRFFATYHCLICFLGIWATLFPSSSSANDNLLLDKIVLKNGGVMHGQAEEIVENNQKLYRVTTPDGASIKLKRSQVAQIRKPTEAIREYLKRQETMLDTVDGHWEMQQWCVDNQRRDPQLQERREYHLMRIVEMDSDHEDARARR